MKPTLLERVKLAAQTEATPRAIAARAKAPINLVMWYLKSEGWKSQRPSNCC